MRLRTVLRWTGLQAKSPHHPMNSSLGTLVWNCQPVQRILISRASITVGRVLRQMVLGQQWLNDGLDGLGY